MNAIHKRAAVVIGCLTLAIAFLAPPATHGDEWNLATRFTINHPFEVPGMVLQSNTPYVIRLLDSPSNRSVVQIYNSDQTHMLTMFMAIADERVEQTDRTQFTFIETQPAFPLPIKEWFYPGHVSGLEFVYPKDQAREIAGHAREAVLAADSNDLSRLKDIKVEAIGPVTNEGAVTESASTVTKSETTEKTESTAVSEEKPIIAETPAPSVEQEQNAEVTQPNTPDQIAQNTESTVKTESNVEEEKATPAPAATEENQELPRTAGELPLFAVIGVMCLGAGLGLKVLSAKP
jgi:hypothetical protein